MSAPGLLAAVTGSSGVGVEIIKFQNKINEYGEANITILKHSDLLSDFVLYLPNLHPSLLQLNEKNCKGIEQFIQSVEFSIDGKKIYHVTGTQLMMETNNSKGFIKLLIPKINM